MLPSRSIILSIFLLCAPVLLAAQHIELTTKNQMVRKGKPNALFYNRPDGLSSVRLVVPFGSSRSSFHSRTITINGKQEHWADSVFIWEFCDTPETRTWVVSQGFDQDRQVLQDTTWFIVVSDSVSPRLMASGGGGMRPATSASAIDLIGVGPPSKTFFGNEPPYDVVSYEVTITQEDKFIEHFAVDGSHLSAEQLAIIGKYVTGTVVVHNIRYRHPCGVVLPALHSMELHYLDSKRP